MHQWLPALRHQSTTTPLIARLSDILFNSSKTPRGFGQFTKKTKTKKTDSASSTDSSSAAPKSPESTTPKSTESAATKKESKSTVKEEKKPAAKKTEEAPKKKGKLFSSKSKSSSNESGSSSSEKGGKQWYEQIPPWMLITPLVLALAFSPNIKYNASSNGITFQQFKIQLLEQGLVDHIEVVNKTTARVFLRSNMATGGNMKHNLDDSTTDSVYGHFSPNKVYEFNIGDIQTFEEKLEHAQIAMGIEPRDWVPVQYIQEISVRDSLFSFISSGPILTLLIFWWVIRMFRKSGAFGLPGAGAGGKGGGFGPMSGLFDVTKANFKVINKGEKIKTKFKDVAGLDNAKEEVGEFVHFLRDPGAYTKLGARIPKGALLSGPPGCGKTLLARAVAGEADCPFFSISGSDFVEMFVGVGPSRVRNLFEEARKNAPCIIFIDEIDAVGRKRGRGGFAGGNDERENTLNQLLVEMDGFKSDSNIVVLAGTNRSDILDSALTRPGRFDRQITIDKPDIKGRIEIFKVHLRNVKLAAKEVLAEGLKSVTEKAEEAKHEKIEGAEVSEDGKEEEDAAEEEETEIDVNSTIYNDVATRMATLTPGFSGADIANIVNEAALRAARKNKGAVDIQDFYEANDRVIGGLEKRISSMTLKEKEMIAHHEAGHAVAGWFLENAEPLLKVTIIPRASGALGFAQYLPKELQLYNAAQLYDMMCMALGGRAAEQIFYNRVSTGAADDLNKVTKIAYGQITIYGMNDKLGNLSFPPENQEGGMVTYRPYSEKTAEMIDHEAQILVRKAYDDTLALLTKYKDKVSALADELMAKETIGHEDIVGVLGERPVQNDAYKAYLENTKEWERKYQEEEEGAKMEMAEAEVVEESTNENESESVEESAGGSGVEEEGNKEEEIGSADAKEAESK